MGTDHNRFRPKGTTDVLPTPTRVDTTHAVELQTRVPISFERLREGPPPDLSGPDLSSELPESLCADLEEILRLPAAQQPVWPDAQRAREIGGVLRDLPPLTVPSEIDRLTAHLAQVALGNAYVLQGGDCAETFSGNTEHHVFANLRTLTQMALLIGRGAGKPVLRIGRVAGQYAKPRSAPLDEAGLPAYRGDMINCAVPTPQSRAADPARKLQAYANAGATLNLVRAYAQGELANLPALGELAASCFADTPAARAYDRLLARNGWGPGARAVTGDIFASHELLVLDYEEPLVRSYERDGELKLYDVSTHFLWIGERTRQLDGAHVQLARRLSNPIGVKLGPSTTAAQVAEYVERLDPDAVPGRITLISRMGHDRVREALPPIVERVSALGHVVVWQCDPMHGNTFRSADGLKTRRFDQVTKEVLGFLEVHRELGTHPGGLHLEFAGEQVTECLGGWDGIQEADLPLRYESACDPRLAARQALELALLVAGELGR